MTTGQIQILDFIRTGPNQTRTAAEIFERFGAQYYRNAEKYVGQRLTALIKGGFLTRPKKGVYTVGGEKIVGKNQTELFQ